jgi:DNA (cytosine-5)-methyltransferase 3A
MKNVLSLFNGMSCLQIALQELGMTYDKYYSSEIDKHAIKANMAMYPDTIQLGDITKWREWDIDWSLIDFIGAGSPCQGFSFAGKGLNFSDPRSKLFFVFIEILNHVKKNNPNVLFLLENVRMKKEHEIVITRYCGVNPIAINSSLVSAQSRYRLYWTNINQKPYGLFGDMFSDIPQPQDQGILLRDILESEVDEKYFLSEKMIKTLTKERNNGNGVWKAMQCKMEEDKSSTITSRVHKMGKSDTYLRTKQPTDKASCFTAGGHSGGLHSDMDLILQRPRGNNKGGEKALNGKTPSLTSNSYENNNFLQIANIYDNEANSAAGRVYDDNGKSVTLKSEGGGGGAKTGLYLIQSRIRRLTPTECFRLQKIPEHHIKTLLNSGISDTQLYRMAGNGWTVSVIVHILKHMTI